ncbi:MAG: hypothetical protein FWH22_03660 [Fibromonadales bacterium]|nr:hypothetical protein [Fibromonadales bacterium]
MLISFLKKDEDGKSQSKFMGKGDIIFLLVLALLIGGGWYLFKTSKEETHEHYAKCDALYLADNLIEAKECYEDGALKLNYRIDSLDSIGYLRIGIIDSVLSE